MAKAKTSKNKPVGKEAPKKKKLDVSSDEEEEKFEENYVITAIRFIPKGKFALKMKEMQVTQEEILELQKKMREEEEEEERMMEEDGEMGSVPVDFSKTFFRNEEAQILENDEYLKEVEDSDDEEDELAETDIQIIAACNSHEVSTIQSYIYEEENAHHFLHHDLLSEEHILDLAWLDYAPGDESSTRNIIAVASFDPIIEIWDNDVKNPHAPLLSLGSDEKESHKGGVLSLSWNSQHRNFLLSGGEDSIVKLWDLRTGKLQLSMNHHNRQVSNLEWNPSTPEIFVSCGFDRKVFITDPRDSAKNISYKIPCDPEDISWNPNIGHEFVVALENGTISCFDSRKGLVGNFKAHTDACHSVQFSDSKPNIIVSGGEDGVVKIWNTTNLKAGPIFFQTYPVPIFSAQMHQNFLAVGGVKFFSIKNLQKAGGDIGKLFS